MGIYRNPVPQPGTGRVFTHIVDSPDFPGRFVDWENVGKFVPAVNPAAARLVAESAGLSENIERLIGKYGGKRKMRKTRKQQRKRKQIRKKT
jgi:hypothetical protein